MRRHWIDRLKGGKADKCNPDDFDPRELNKGRKHEKEHTKNKHIATEIAMDHLVEDSHYYDKLDRMEKSKKKRK
jgi:hypothetical protein